jgi:hypothetical protein
MVTPSWMFEPNPISTGSASARSVAPYQTLARGQRDLTDEARVGRHPGFGVQLLCVSADGHDQRLGHDGHRR